MIDEKLFKKINPPENEIIYGDDIEKERFKNIHMVDNRSKYNERS